MAPPIDLLRDYQGDLANRAAAAAVEFMWGAHKAMLRFDDPNHFDEAIKWAKVFWGVNSMTSGCIHKKDVETLDDGVTEPADGEQGGQAAYSVYSAPRSGRPPCPRVARICAGSPWTC